MVSLYRVLCCFALLLSCSLHAAPEKLLIWIEPSQARQGLEKVAARFSETFGMAVEVEAPPIAASKYPLFAANGNGPDIIIWSHDKIGTWARQGVIAPVPLSAKQQAQFVPLAVQAMTFSNQVYAYPLAIEVLSLAYNKNWVSQAPKTWRDIEQLQVKLAAEQVQSIRWHDTDSHYQFPFLAAFGAYSFARHHNQYDTSHSGIEAGNAHQGLDFLRDLYQSGWLVQGFGQHTIYNDFQQQRQAMILVNPTQWRQLQQLDFPVGLTTLPEIYGRPIRPWITVYAAMINRYSEQQDVAQYFIEQFLLTEPGLHALNSDVPLGVPAFIPYLNHIASHPWVQVSFNSLKHADLLPNVPKVGRLLAALTGVWQNLHSEVPSKELLKYADKMVEMP
ncbi:maltose/maltodextrin ABC transporter substrate-binding protein MalE [Motilimonas pumila]|uniref:maltose/maltodextrin ABC transporter substrate-binding protein MalE n=1 Tax=Motilimonas pumila TaxID=2303987 RepID=UPI0013141B66|nr:maltose/maltodextrin ABC transporter substrate-binding protein MalE [Motilimonas pumila]